MNKKISQFIIKPVIILAGIIVLRNAAATEVSGPGFTPLGEIAASSISNNTFSGYYADQKLGLNLILTRQFDSYCDTALPNVRTPDGKYYGWELSPGSGVYGVIYDSVLTAWLWTSDKYTQKSSITATWLANGQASTNGTDQTANCYTSVPRATSGKNFAMRHGENTLSGLLKYGVYVDPTSRKAGSYTLRFNIGKFMGKYNPVTQTFIVNLTACTVSTLTQIRFGTVDANSRAPIISPNGGLDISCAGQPTSVNLTYSAEAVVYQADSPTELMMSNSKGEKQGTVRGFIGVNAESDAGCSDKVSSVRFDATTVSLKSGAKNNQSHNFPLIWVLCSKQSAQPGEGKANAILNINWL